MELTFKNGDKPLKFKKRDKNLVLTKIFAVKGDIMDFCLMVEASNKVGKLDFFITPQGIQSLIPTKDKNIFECNHPVNLKNWDTATIRGAIRDIAGYNEYEFILSIDNKQ